LLWKPPLLFTCAASWDRALPFRHCLLVCLQLHLHLRNHGIAHYLIGKNWLAHNCQYRAAGTAVVSDLLMWTTVVNMAIICCFIVF
jgi:hypothetical protein